MKDTIGIVFIGDIVGESGISTVVNNISELRKRFEPDFIIANGENADQGKGITKREAKVLFEVGIDVITTGNHVWDNWYSKPLLVDNPKVLRPFNYPSGNVGMGYYIIDKEDVGSLCVANLQGRTFMQTIDCPFKAADYLVKTVSEKTKNIFIDFHADATAEKIALSWYLDGRVSALVGTHTHIPTSDASILPNGTAYITDVGMTGPFDSVVGMKKEQAIKRFVLQIPHKYEVATEDNRICGVHVVINNINGLAQSIEQFIIPKFENGI